MLNQGETTKDRGVQVARGYLSSKFFPPLPGAYAEPLLEAVEALEDYDGERVIRLPLGIDPHPSQAWLDDDEETWLVTADDLARILHVDKFVSDWLEVL